MIKTSVLYTFFFFSRLIRRVMFVCIYLCLYQPIYLSCRSFYLSIQPRPNSISLYIYIKCSVLISRPPPLFPFPFVLFLPLPNPTNHPPSLQLHSLALLSPLFFKASTEPTNSDLDRLGRGSNGGAGPTIGNRKRFLPQQFSCVYSKGGGCQSRFWTLRFFYVCMCVR